MNMKKADDNNIANEEVEAVVGEVLSREEADKIKRAMARPEAKPPLRSFITSAAEIRDF